MRKAGTPTPLRVLTAQEAGRPCEAGVQRRWAVLRRKRRDAHGKGASNAVARPYGARGGTPMRSGRPTPLRGLNLPPTPDPTEGSHPMPSPTSALLDALAGGAVRVVDLTQPLS